MSLMRRALCLAALLALAGCANMPLPGTEAAEVAGLLHYYERVGSLPIAEQRREFNEAQADYERGASDHKRLKLALALLLPKAPWRDDARVQQLLGGMEAVPADQASPRRDLALLLQKLVAERQRLWREESRKVEGLQQKIDALREIDRETRPHAPRRRAQ